MRPAWSSMPSGRQACLPIALRWPEESPGSRRISVPPAAGSRRTPTRERTVGGIGTHDLAILNLGTAFAVMALHASENTAEANQPRNESPGSRAADTGQSSVMVQNLPPLEHGAVRLAGDWLTRRRWRFVGQKSCNSVSRLRLGVRDPRAQRDRSTTTGLRDVAVAISTGRRYDKFRPADLFPPLRPPTRLISCYAVSPAGVCSNAACRGVTVRGPIAGALARWR